MEEIEHFFFIYWCPIEK